MAKVPDPAYWRTRWRSWIDPQTKPDEGDRNLWDEFFALLHRREMWRGYREALAASPENARTAARWLTAWVQRNHVETQAIAIRRISDRSTTHKDSIALGRLLDEIAAHPEVLGDELSSQALEDAVLLQAASRSVSVFATKVVAHFDRDHALASQDLKWDDFDKAVDVTTALFDRWYRAVTGEGLAIIPPSIGWENVVRLHRRDLSIDNADSVGARVAYTLGTPAVQELLEALERSEEDRAALIGRLYVRAEARWLAELLIEIEEDPDDLVRLNLIAALRRVLGR